MDMIIIQWNTCNLENGTIFSAAGVRGFILRIFLYFTKYTEKFVADDKLT